MGLAETQRLLACLYTDADLRARFFANPEALGVEWGLMPGEIQSLAETPASQITFFARSLVNKRLGEVRRLLPRTCQALGLQEGEMFRQYADDPIPSGIKKHRSDALGFAAFLAQKLSTEPNLPDSLRDILPPEIGWLKAGEPSFRWHVCVTRRAHGFTLLVWWRWTQRGPVRYAAIPLPRLL